MTHHGPKRAPRTQEELEAAAERLRPVVQAVVSAIAREVDSINVRLRFDRRGHPHLEVRTAAMDYKHLRGQHARGEKALHTLGRAWAKSVPVFVDLISPEQQAAEARRAQSSVLS